MNVSTCSLERVYDRSVFVTRACEIEWINKLNTTKPNGANTKAHLNLLLTYHMFYLAVVFYVLYSPELSVNGWRLL